MLSLPVGVESFAESEEEVTVWVGDMDVSRLAEWRRQHSCYGEWKETCYRVPAGAGLKSENIPHCGKYF